MLRCSRFRTIRMRRSRVVTGRPSELIAMKKLLACVSLAILVLLAADNPLEGDKFLEKADEKFYNAATLAQEAYAKAMAQTFETRLKTYKSILAAATKAGDFDRATAVKIRIEEIEAEAKGVG